MQKKDFNQGITFKVYPQKHRRADGMNTLYLRITISRSKKEFNLKTSWPAEFFDANAQMAMPRLRNDADVASVNMIIGEAKSRANRIRMRFFSDDKLLSLDAFAREFENYESRENFIYFWDNKIQQRFREGAISAGTKKHHIVILNKFQEFVGNANFYSIADINADLVQRYQTWLRRQKLKYNYIISALTIFKTYVRAAMADGLRIEDPFGKLSLKFIAGDREVLERDELARLKKLYEEEEMDVTMREVLRKFLFSCYTGLRISDSSQLHSSMISNGILRLKTIKGERYGKEVQIPLPDYALKLIEKRRGLVFQPLVDQTCNKWLKVIAASAKPAIEKSLSFHVSRDTFATLFIEMGGDVFTLKELMGHSDIKTTMIYVKMSENRKGVLMANFNNL